MPLGIIPLSVAGQSSFRNKPENLPENVLKDDTSIWHSHRAEVDKRPYIALKMEREEKVFMVKVVDRLECPDCSGRYKDVEVRVSSTLSYDRTSRKSLNLDNSVSCGIKSGDGVAVTVHK